MKKYLNYLESQIVMRLTFHLIYEISMAFMPMVIKMMIVSTFWKQ